MLNVTNAAATAVQGVVAAAGLPGEAGLRIAVAPQQDGQPDGTVALTASITPGPSAEDQVLDTGDGSHVFLEPRAAKVCDGQVLDASVDEAGRVQFLLDEAPDA